MSRNRLACQVAGLLVLCAGVMFANPVLAQNRFYCSSDGQSYAQGKGGILCPTPPNVVPLCPDGHPCVCVDFDGSCFDGDDDWGYPPNRTPPPVQPQAPAYAQPQVPAYGQPQAPAYGQPQVPAYGQPQVPAYGQPQTTQTANNCQAALYLDVTRYPNGVLNSPMTIQICSQPGNAVALSVFYGPPSPNGQPTGDRFFYSITNAHSTASSMGGTITDFYSDGLAQACGPARYQGTMDDMGDASGNTFRIQGAVPQRFANCGLTGAATRVARVYRAQQTGTGGTANTGGNTGGNTLGQALGAALSCVIDKSTC